MQAMTLEQVYYIAELIGVLAVIASLIYLALHLRQNNKMIRLGTLHDISSQYVTCMLTMSHDQESTDVWVNGLAKVDELALGPRALSHLHGRFYAHALRTTLPVGARRIGHEHMAWDEGDHR